MNVATFDKDFDALEAGERFSTQGRTVGEADIMGFAALTGDTHPQHTDAEWAARSRFGERIAHGLLVLSYAAGLVPFDPDRVVALRKVGDAVFKAPVKIGDTIHVDGEVTKTRALDEEHGLVECRWKVVNQRGKLVLRVGVEVVWRRGEPVHGPAPAAAGEPVLI
jgi:3-hydroxybutyryl-CoA dehydratase